MQRQTDVIKQFVKCPTYRHVEPDGTGYRYFYTTPCKGMLYVNDDTPYFITGQVKVHGEGGGRYPMYYLDMIDSIFGPEPNTIEVCSKTVFVDKIRTACTVDIKPESPCLVCADCKSCKTHAQRRLLCKNKIRPSMVGDAQVLPGIKPRTFKRWRGDPPYRVETAEGMYETDLPSFIRLLEAEARVLEVGGLMFLLLGGESGDNYQHHPPGVMRIGLIYISVSPNNETRTLNIYWKYKHYETQGYQAQL